MDHRTAALCGILAAAFAATGTPAQEARVVLPAEARHTPSARPLPPLRTVAEVPGEEPADDAPDFAPTSDERSADGRHVAQRLAGDPYVLSFTGGDYRPEPGIDAGMLELQREGVAHTFGYVMIEGRMAERKMAALRALGVEILDVHTWQSVVARIPLAQLQAIAGLPFVRWVGYPQPVQKLGVRLREALATRPAGEALELLIDLYRPDSGGEPSTVRIGEDDDQDPRIVSRSALRTMPNGERQRALEALGFRPVFYDQTTYTFAGAATPALVRTLQGLDWVRFLELRVPHRANHDQVMSMIGQDRIRGSFPGKDVPVGIIDSGLDGTPSVHQDLEQKGYLGWRSDNSLPSPFDDSNGHGTHVGGTVFGTGAADQRYVGAAPAVGAGGDGDRIFIGRFLGDDGKSKGFAKSLYDVFKSSQSYNNVANPKPAVVNNSWGGSSADGFKGSEYESRTVDAIVWEANQTYVFAAGNTGDVAGTWCDEPGCAKNVLTVGAVNDAWGGSTVPGARASFSRYATADGRLKPEVCAPGNETTSVRNNTYSMYDNMSGTSMAAPAVTGAIASLIDRDSGFRYSPAAVKAAVMACATLDGSMNGDVTRGYGQVSSYKMNRVDQSTYEVHSGKLTSSGSYATFDIPVSANCRAFRATLVMIEPAASAGASQARRNDLRLFLDVPPYSSGGNTGEYSNSSGVHTVISLQSDGGSLLDAVQGKTVRVKVWAQSINTFDDVEFAVALIQYFRAPDHQKVPTLVVEPSVKAILPSNDLHLDVSVVAQAAADDVSNVRVWYEGPGGWEMQQFLRITGDAIHQLYDKGNLHPSADFPKVGRGSSSGMLLGTGRDRGIRFTLRSPATEGWHDLDVRATYHHGLALGTVTKVCVDNSAPNKALGLKSTSHTAGVWSNQTQLVFQWSQITDNGCAGIDRQYYELSSGGPKGVNIGSPSVAAAQGWAIVDASSSAAGWYFNLGAEDKVGFWSPTATIGPFRVDALEPVVDTLTLDGGATHTGSLTVLAKVAASDAHSGVDRMQLSLDNAKWSPWLAFTGQQLAVDLSNAAWGGHANQGVHRVYCRVVDAAGNVSATRDTLITYLVGPVLTKATVATLPSITADWFRLEGANISGVKSVSFAGRTVTSSYDSQHDSAWANGYFRRFASGAIWFFPPQGLPPGKYPVRVSDGVNESNELLLEVTPNTDRIVRSARTMLLNGLQTIWVTRGDLPQTVTGIVMASPSNQPSVLPGIFDFAIGNAFQSYLLLPERWFDKYGQMKIAFPVPASLVGLTVYFQAGYLEKVGTPTWPMPASDVWSTSYVK